MAVLGFFRSGGGASAFFHPPAALQQSGASPAPRRVCLVTGANRGLGRGIASRLASLGDVRVFLACRSQLDSVCDDVRTRASDLLRADSSRMERHASLEDDNVELEAVALDLNDVQSVLACVDAVETALRAKNETIDWLVCNAAVVPTRAEFNAAGLETAYAINYVGHFVLVQELVRRGLLTGIPPGTDLERRAEASPSVQQPARITIVTSESHRISKPLSQYDLVQGRFEYTMSAAISHYGFTKMLLATWAFELARRLRGLALVSAICPGPVDSDIARSAPKWMQTWLVKPMMYVFFKDPAKAAIPVVETLMRSNDRQHTVDSGTAVYFHMRTAKPPRSDAMDELVGLRLWQDTVTLLQRGARPST